MATYYIAEGGTAANKAAATTGTYPGGCMSVTVHNAGPFAAGDSILFSDEGGVIRGKVWPPTAGSDGSPITYGAKAGDSPVISAANVVETWTSEGSDIYSADLTTETPQVFMDDVRLVQGASEVSLNDHEWFWLSNKLYVRDDSGDPDVTGVVIEGSVETRCITNGTPWMIFENLVLEKSTQENLNLHTAAANIIIRNYGVFRALWRGIVKDGGAQEAANVTIDSCEVAYCGGNGIHAGGNSASWHVLRNHCHHNSQLHSRDDYTADIKTNASSGHIIEYNLVENGRHVGIWCDTAGSGIYIQYNLVRNQTNDWAWAGQGIRLEDGITDSFVLYNVVYGCENAGVVFSGTGSGGTGIHRNTAYGNTCYDNGTYGIQVNGLASGGVAKCTDNVVKNNICIGHTYELDGHTGGENDGTMGSGNVYESNCFDLESSNFILWGAGNYYSTYDDWIAASSQTDNNVEADPSFTDAAGGDLTLASDSPCIDAGVDLGASYDDALLPASTWPDGVVTGDQDYYGVGWNIGAYLYGTISPVSTSYKNRTCRILHLIMGR